MTKRATTGKRAKAPEVPAIDLDFKTAVSRLMQVKPGNVIDLLEMDGVRWSVSVNGGKARILPDWATAKAEALTLAAEYQAEVWIEDGSEAGRRRLLTD